MHIFLRKNKGLASIDKFIEVNRSLHIGTWKATKVEVKNTAKTHKN